MRRLLISYPPPPGSDSADELVAIYLGVASQFGAADVEDGIRALLLGQVAGFDGRFMPSPTQLALAIRQAIDVRVAASKRRAAPALPAPDIVHDAESRARVKARVEAFIASVAVGQGSADEAAGERARALAEKVAQRFDPPQDAASLSERLVKRRDSAGAAR